MALTDQEPSPAARVGTEESGADEAQQNVGAEARESAGFGPGHIADAANTMRRHADEAAELLKALANGQRLRILCILVEGERSVGELNEQLDLSQSALSQHLARLREEGLVHTRREAQNVFYSLAEGPAGRLIGALHEIYCQR